MGWGEVDDAESVRAIHCAIDLGVRLFDTADMYGCGHSERILGRALSGRSEAVTVVTKFGYHFDEISRQIVGQLRLPDDLERACDASLRRLSRDTIDVYLLHLRDLDLQVATEVRGHLERLVERGKIRTYGWSTDDLERARLFADGPHCVAIEQAFNLFQGDAATLALCEEEGLWSLQRSPLAMGILSGRFSAGSATRSTTSSTTSPASKVTSRAATDDVRARFDFEAGPIRAMVEQLEKIRAPLTEGGRTLAQGALSWLWANSPAAMPIPGFRTVTQVEEHAAAPHFAPFSADALRSIDAARRALGPLPPNPWDLGSPK